MGKRRTTNDAGSLSSVSIFKDVFVSNKKRLEDRGKKYREATRLSGKAKYFIDKIIDLGCVVVAENNTLYVYAPDAEGIVVLKDGRKARCIATIDFKKTEVPF